MRIGLESVARRSWDPPVSSRVSHQFQRFLEGTSCQSLGNAALLAPQPCKVRAAASVAFKPSPALYFHLAAFLSRAGAL